MHLLRWVATAACLLLPVSAVAQGCPGNPKACGPGTLNTLTIGTSIQLVPQVGAPAVLQDGDMWTTDAGLFARIAGATVGPFGNGGGNVSSSGTPTNGQIAQWTSPSTIQGITNTQLTADINIFSSTLSGAVPASGGGTTNFLRADGTWAPPTSGGTPGGTTGQIQFNNSGTFGGFTASGDATINTGTGAILVTKTNGSLFAPSATTDTTNAGNISSGTLPAARLPAPSATTLGGVESAAAVSHQWINSISTLGVPSLSQPGVSDLSGFGTGVAAALAVNIGTAGAPVILNGAGGTPSSITLTNATGLPTAGLNSGAVTYAKIQNGASNGLLGVNLGGAPTEVAIGSGLSLSAGTLSATGGSSAFSALTSGTNTSAAMVIGTGATLGTTGSGAITATAAPLGGITGLGTGIATALGTNVGIAGAPVILGGAGGTPSSITLTNATGYPVATSGAFGIVKPDNSTITVTGGVITAVGGSATSIVPGTTTIGGSTAPCFIANSATTVMACDALGTGVVTALGTNVGSAGSFVVNGGALGTPSSGTLTNATGLPIAGLTGLGTGVPAALAAAATGSGGIVLATSPTLVTPNLGTPSTLVATNATGTASGLTSGVTNGLASATTTVAVNAATAPTSGQVLTATSGTAANWQTPAAAPTAANPTATAGSTAVNGVATTFMRSDAAPAIALGSASTFGLVKVDGTTITATGGVISSVGGSATSITPGTTTIAGATAPCLIENSATNVMACPGVGTGVITALGVNVGSAGSFVVNGGALGTPSSGTLTNATGLPVSSGISGLGTGVATFLATPSSANLAATVTGETGSGALVFGTSPTLVTPALGTPSAVVLTNGTGLPIAGITGLGTGVSGALAAAVTGSGGIVLATSPTLTTPNLGTPSAVVLTNATGTAASLTAGTATAANGLKTATTTVAISTATAPTTGQVLTATSGTAATWQTPTGGSSWTLTDGTNSVANVTQVTVQGLLVGGSGGLATLVPNAGIRTAASPTLATTDFAGAVNISSGGITAPAGLFSGATNNPTIFIGNAQGSSAAITNSTGLTINTGNGCNGTSIPANFSQQWQYNGASIDCWQFASSGSGSSAFSSLTGGTNTTAAMLVGTGASLGVTGSGTITATAAPVSGLTGAGTGVLSALAVNVGSAGAPVLFNGAGGTPSSITLTNASGTAASLTAGVATVANGLDTTGAAVVLTSAAPPTTGQVLTATSATAANWQTPTGGASWTLTDGTHSVTSVTTLTTGAGLIVGGSAGSATLNTTVADTTHTVSATVANIGGQDDYNGSSLTATLATLAAGQTALVTNQNASTLTIGNNSQTVNGLPLSTSLHTGGFYGYAFNSTTSQISAWGFPGFDTITANAVPKFSDASGATTASSISDAGSGVTIGGPTGGAKGLGTLNVQNGIYANGVLQTIVTPPSAGALAYYSTTGAQINGVAITANVLPKSGGTGAPSASSITDNLGVTIGSPTGGAQGAGTLNATGLFVNGVAVAGASGVGVQSGQSPSNIGDNATALPSGHYVYATNVAMTAARSHNLPDSATQGAGDIEVIDSQQTVTGTNTLTVAAAGTDTLNGVTNGTAVLSTAGAAVALHNDGAGHWTTTWFSNLPPTSANKFLSTNASGAPTWSTLGTNVATAMGNALSAAGGLTTTVASGTATLGTSAIASGACATVVTVSATGVATTDVVQFSYNGDPTAVTGYGASATGAVLSIYPYPTANNVNVKVCNSTASSITPGAMTLNFRVAR